MSKSFILESHVYKQFVFYSNKKTNKIGNHMFANPFFGEFLHFDGSKPPSVDRWVLHLLQLSTNVIQPQSQVLELDIL
jgi:hypothetical protein